jgi:hypothetical protein
LESGGGRRGPIEAVRRDNVVECLCEWAVILGTNREMWMLLMGK